MASSRRIAGPALRQEVTSPIWPDDGRREVAPVRTGDLVIGSDDLDADVIGSRVTHRLHAMHDHVVIAPGHDRVDESVATSVGSFSRLCRPAPPLVV